MDKSITKIPTLGMSRADWLAERRKSLGGSDMGAVLGLNRFRSPYSVWADKTGKLPDAEDTEAMRIGRDLEPYVLRRFAEKSGLRTRHINAIMRNDAFPHIHANVDSVVIGQRAGVEAKTASALNTRAFSGGDFPESYYAQCVTYLAITGYQRWYLAVLIMGREFKIYQMTRVFNDDAPEWCEASIYVSDGEVTALAAAAADFWRYVETNTPPPVDGLKATGEALTAIYSQSDGGTVDLAAVDSGIRNYLMLKKQVDELSGMMEEQKNQIMAYMEDAERGETGNVRIIWKTQTREVFDRKSFQKAYPEIDLSLYSKTSTSRPFKLTVVK